MLENHVQNFLAKIPRQGSTVDLQPLFFNLTMDSSTESLFGESILCQPSYEGSDAQKFADAFNYAQAELQLRHTLGRLSIFRRNAKFNDACKTIHDFADKYVKLGLEHRRQVQLYGEKESKGSKERYVFLNSLSESTSDPIQLRNELLNILLAGRDTTAGLLSNCFHALARHPEVWNKLKVEVDALEGRLPDYETLKNMTYLKWVLNEGDIFNSRAMTRR
jgi:cytochrome P450